MNYNIIFNDNQVLIFYEFIDIMNIMSVLDIALNLHKQGYNVIPLEHRSKKPKKGLYWKKYQKDKQIEKDVVELFSTHGGNIGVVCGEVSGNLVVLDADKQNVFDYLCEKLNYLNPRIIRSGRGGHLYFRSDMPVTSKTVDIGVGIVEVRSEGLYVVSENSLHPTGNKYQVINNFPIPTIKAEIPLFGDFKLDALPGATNFDYLLNNVYRNIFNKKYKSLSESDMAIITCLVKKGYKKDIISRVLVNCKHGSKFSELLSENDKQAYTWLDVAINKALLLKDDDSYIQVVSEMDNLLRLMSTATIKGKSGPTLYKVITCHIETCKRIGSYEYNLSVRNGCESTGLSLTTFTKQNKLLITEGIVKKIDGFSKMGNTYIIDQNKLKQLLGGSEQEKNNGVKLYGEIGMFEYRSYGHSSNQIYNLIKSNNAISAIEISQITGRHINTVRKVLKQLLLSGIITKNKKVYSPVESIDMNNIALKEGFITNSTERKNRHKYERRKYNKQ